MLLTLISTNSENCCGSPAHDKPESKLKPNNGTRREIICYFKEKKNTGRKGNVPDSFKLLSKTLTYFEAGNHLQIHLGNSPDRVWKKGDFWENYVLFHFFCPTEHTPEFHNSTDTPQLAQQELPLDLPVLHRHSIPEAMGTPHTGLWTCPTGGVSIRTFFSQKWFLSAWCCTAIGTGAISLEPAPSHWPAQTLLLSLCLRNQQGKWENPEKQKPNSSTKSRLRKTQRTE